MRSALRWSLPFCLVALAGLWLASTVQTTGDWSTDAWPAVSALAHGRVADYLSAEAIMGPFSTMVQAPFVALAGGSGLHAYRWAAFPCLLAAGLLGLYLGRLAGRHGAPKLAQALIAGLCLVNPLTVEALRYGHPEEVLTAALAVGAVATASEGHRGRTALLLGLAIASKQWAVIAILPALMALPGRRLRVGAAALAIAAALTLPSLIADPGSFSEVNSNAASAGRVATPWSVWYPLVGTTSEEHRTVAAGPGRSAQVETIVAHVHRTPPLIGSLSHPLIVALALLLPLALALRRGAFRISGADAMALLALIALLRCALDPLDNVYYHAPLLLVLLGWDAIAPGRLPVRGIAGAALSLLFWRWSNGLGDVTLYSYAYLGVVLAVGVAITSTLFRSGRSFTGYPDDLAHHHPQTRIFPVRTSNFEDQVAGATAD